MGAEEDVQASDDAAVEHELRRAAHVVDALGEEAERRRRRLEAAVVLALDNLPGNHREAEHHEGLQSEGVPAAQKAFISLRDSTGRSFCCTPT